ncbi:MAG TPA: DUF4434 domain-containing protein [Phycisphaerae bacterium]|nr:DUF4434 domain-containing protein [Phycisphaerae bacterium]
MAAPINLTLIPPSPVTNKIVLDVRGTVWNDSDTAQSFEVALYLDSEAQAALLHRQTVLIPPHASRGVYCHQPMAGLAGHHQAILTAMSGGQTCRTTQPLEVLASASRSTERLGGAWAGLYHWSEREGKLWNSEIKTMTDGQWRELVRGMHDLQMDIIVIQEVFRNQMYYGEHTIEKDGYRGRAFYPSRLFPERMPICAADPVEAILSEADRLGMHVFPGVGLYAWFDFTAGSLQWHKQVVDELYAMYGHHPSLYGWYVSEEIFGDLGNDPKRFNEIINFFREFQSHCRAMAPDKPLMLAPNCHFVGRAAEPWRQVLAHCDILCPFGFHRMPEGDVTGEEAAALMQRLCDEAGAHLWMDMEAFLFGPESELYPRPINGLVSDLVRFPNFEKILCYQYPGLMNAPSASIRPGGEDTVRLYVDYQRFLEKSAANQ